MQAPAGPTHTSSSGSSSTTNNNNANDGSSGTYAGTSSSGGSSSNKARKGGGGKGGMKPGRPGQQQQHTPGPGGMASLFSPLPLFRGGGLPLDPAVQLLARLAEPVEGKRQIFVSSDTAEQVLGAGGAEQRV